MKISIAMTTYNGAKYLQEQLESFAVQTRLPDELVVTDDCSTDDTCQILNAFAKTAPFPVHIYRNETNLGCVQNFGRVLSLCDGELVFLSDQDDIWFRDKIEKIVQFAAQEPDVMLFMNDAELTLDDGKPLGLTKLGQTLSLGREEFNFVTGCCMAIRNTFLQFALPIPSSFPAHDGWLSKMAVTLGVKKVVPQILQYYRRHGANTSSWLTSRTEKVSSFDLLVRYYKDGDPRPHAVRRLEQLLQLKERLNNCPDILLMSPFMSGRIENALLKISAERKAVDTRLRLLALPRWRRWFSLVRFCYSGQYTYFSGKKSLIKDLILR